MVFIPFLNPSCASTWNHYPPTSRISFSFPTPWVLFHLLNVCEGLYCSLQPWKVMAEYWNFRGQFPSVLKLFFTLASGFQYFSQQYQFFSFFFQTSVLSLCHWLMPINPTLLGCFNTSTSLKHQMPKHAFFCIQSLILGIVIFH